MQADYTNHADYWWWNLSEQELAELNMFVSTDRGRMVVYWQRDGDVVEYMVWDSYSAFQTRAEGAYLPPRDAAAIGPLADLDAANKAFTELLG